MVDISEIRVPGALKKSPLLTTVDQTERAGVNPALKFSIKKGCPAIGVNVAEAPSVQDRYNRLRGELWFNVREWLEQRDVRLPLDGSLVAELSLPAYRVLSTGKIQVESKDEMKKRGARSPDLADALCLTFARGIALGPDQAAAARVSEAA